MKSLVVPIILACAALSVLIAFATAGPASATQNEPAAAWEHLALTHDDAGLGGELAAKIVQLGNEGWELVCVVPIAEDGTTVKTRYYFKRPK